MKCLPTTFLLLLPSSPSAPVVGSGGNPRGIVTATTVAGWGALPSTTSQPIRPVTPLVSTPAPQSTDNPLTVLAGTAVSALPVSSTQLDGE